MFLTATAIADKFFGKKICSEQIKKWIKKYGIKHECIGHNEIIVVKESDFRTFLLSLPCSATYSPSVPKKDNLLTAYEVNKSILHNSVSTSTIRRAVHKYSIKHIQVGKNGTILIDKKDATRLIKLLN